jgi:hypothetical protein
MYKSVTESMTILAAGLIEGDLGYSDADAQKASKRIDELMAEAKRGGQSREAGMLSKGVATLLLSMAALFPATAADKTQPVNVPPTTIESTLKVQPATEHQVDVLRAIIKMRNEMKQQGGAVDVELLKDLAMKAHIRIL